MKSIGKVKKNSSNSIGKAWGQIQKQRKYMEKHWKGKREAHAQILDTKEIQS